MGGGGVMRTAAKIVGGGCYIGFRGFPTVTPPASASTCRSCSATLPAVTNADIRSSATGSAIVQSPAWELDDWDMASLDEPMVYSPPSRLVFGPAPTIEEAKAATSDLKEAIEKVYFSSPAVTCTNGSTVATWTNGSTTVHGSEQPGPLDLEMLHTKACVTSESAPIIRAVPKSVLNTLYMLKESSEVQHVVASLASDKNVYDAVMKNEKVMEFLKSQKDAGVMPYLDEDTESFASNGHCPAKKVLGTSENVFTQIMDVMKQRVASLVSNVSEFFGSFLGNPEEENSLVDAQRGSTFVDKTMMGASLFLLGILAIAVVLVKRK